MQKTLPRAEFGAVSVFKCIKQHFQYIKFVVQVTFSLILQWTLYSKRYTNSCIMLGFSLWQQKTLYKAQTQVLYYIIYRSKRDIPLDIINVGVIENSQHSPQFCFVPCSNFLAMYFICYPIFYSRNFLDSWNIYCCLKTAELSPMYACGE